MSVKATALVQERTRAKGSNLLALLAIADHAHDDGTNGYPTPATIAWKSRLTERAAEIILRKLVQDGEIEPQWEPTTRRLHLHLRCIVAWEAYQTEGPIPIREKITRRPYPTRVSFALSLVAAADARRADIRERQGTIRERQNDIREILPVENSVTDTLDSTSTSQPFLTVQQPSVQPLIEEQGAAPPPPRSWRREAPEECVDVITRLVHDTFDLLGPPTDAERLDFEEIVIGRCIEFHIPYNNTVVGKAIESALHQRKRAQARAWEDAHASTH
jgi:hypothetical protein